MSWVPLFQTTPHSHHLHSCRYAAYFGDDYIINYIMFWIRSIVPSKSERVLESLEVFHCLRGHSQETVFPQGWPSSTVTAGPRHSWLIHRGPTQRELRVSAKKKEKKAGTELGTDYQARYRKILSTVGSHRISPFSAILQQTGHEAWSKLRCYFIKVMENRTFPCGPVVKNLPFSAGHEGDPWSGN